MKEIQVTDEYMGLDENIRKCQNKETLEDCTTRQYIDTIQKECNCIPYSLKGIMGLNLVDQNSINTICILLLCYIAILLGGGRCLF